MNDSMQTKYKTDNNLVHSKRKAIDLTEQQQDISSSSTTSLSVLFDGISSDELISKHICYYIGKCQHRFISPINRQWYDLYTSCEFPDAPNSDYDDDEDIFVSENEDDYEDEIYLSTIWHNNNNANANKKNTTCYNGCTIEHTKICINEISPNHERSEVLFQLRDSAVMHANISCLQYIHSDLGCQWDRITTMAAARYGHLHVLQYLHINNCPWDNDTCCNAAWKGHLNILIYALQNGCPWISHELCRTAAEHGHFHVLKYLRGIGCQWYANTCAGAAKNGHLDILKYAHVNKCPWDKRTCSNAARYGHLEILQYAHIERCPWDHETCTNAARYGHLNILQYAHENGCPWDEMTCFNAARKGHLNVLIYANENGCPMPYNVADVAFKYNHPHVLKYLVECGCSFQNDVGKCITAIIYDAVDLLQCLHNIGTPWDEMTCTRMSNTAARHGHLPTLQYLHSIGCTFNEGTCRVAVDSGHLHVLQFLYEKGCPWDQRSCKCLALVFKHSHIVQWIEGLQK